MGEFNRAGIIDMLFLQLAVANGEITVDEAVDMYMEKHFVHADGEQACK